MDTIFTWLCGALENGAWLALLASAGWGMASLVLSPCHLSSIPLIVGFVSSREESKSRGAFWVSAMFAIGILASVAAIGAITIAAGRMMGDVGSWANYLVAAVLACVGLYLLGLVPLEWRTVSLPRYRGVWAALLLGLIFGIGVGPCTFAYLAPVLGLVFKVADARPVFSMALILAYGLGHCILIVLAGVCTGAVQRVIDWNDASGAAKWIKRVCGVLVLCGAAWLVLTAR